MPKLHTILNWILVTLCNMEKSQKLKLVTRNLAEVDKWLFWFRDLLLHLLYEIQTENVFVKISLWFCDILINTVRQLQPISNFFPSQLLTLTSYQFHTCRRAGDVIFTSTVVRVRWTARERRSSQWAVASFTSVSNQYQLPLYASVWNNDNSCWPRDFNLWLVSQIFK